MEGHGGSVSLFFCIYKNTRLVGPRKMFHETAPPPPPSLHHVKWRSWCVPTVRPHFLVMRGLLDPSLKKRWLTSVGLILSSSLESLTLVFSIAVSVYFCHWDFLSGANGMYWNDYVVNEFLLLRSSTRTPLIPFLWPICVRIFFFSLLS